MLNFYNSRLINAAFHFIPKNEGVNEPVYSHNLYLETDQIQESIFSLLSSSFKNPVFYSFDYHNSDFIFNPLYNYVSNTFDNEEDLLANSIKICKLLFDKSKNSFIDSGYFFYGNIKDVLIDDELVNVITIIKFEETTSIFDFKHGPNGIQAQEKSGYSLKKPHKICLILDVDREEGYKILQIDPQNKIEADYWMKEFLFLKPHQDKHLFTSEYIKLTLNFAKKNESFKETQSLDKVDLKYKTKEYFAKNEKFSEEEFLDSSFPNKKIKNDFLEFKANYEADTNKTIPDQFEISPVMVNKNARFLRSVIKLDKNFHIYVHGNREKIERIEESDGTKYYKIYFDQES